jgi:hypothetical protein
VTQRDLAVSLVVLSEALGPEAEAARIADLRGEALALLEELHRRGALEARYLPLLDRLAQAQG